MTTDRPAPIRVAITFSNAPLPRPGARVSRWEWEDVLGTGMPKRGTHSKDAEYATRHGFDERDADSMSRVGYATLIRTKRDDGRLDINVTELVTVEPRVLSQFLAAERAVHRRVQATARAGDAMIARGADAISRRVPGQGGKAVVKGASTLNRISAALVELAGDTSRALVEAPERLFVGASAADAHLSHRRERKALLRGMWNPYALTREGKTAALFVASITIVAALLVGTVTTSFIFPSLAPAWRAVATYFAIGIGSTVLFPFLPELRLSAVAEQVGAPLAIASVSLGMTIGAWLVLFLGSEVQGGLKRSMRPGSPVARAFEWAETFAGRHGFWAAFLVLSIPLGPDTPWFYTLALVQTPASKYLLGTLLGTLLRFSLFHYVPLVYYNLWFP